MMRIFVTGCFLLWFSCLLGKLPSLMAGWFFAFEVQPLSISWIALWIFLGGGLLYFLPKINTERQYILLFLGGWLLPVFLSLAGMQSLLDHCVQSGHAEFVVTGSRGMSVYDVIHNYEQLVLHETQRYAASKPPGQVLLYSFLHFLSPNIGGDVPAPFVDVAHRELSVLLTGVMPLLAGCVVFPMFSLAQRLKLKRPWVPVLLFLVSAPYSLVVMHMDQALYPTLALTTLLFIHRGWEEESRWWSIMAGGVFGLGCFMSFSLLPVVILLGLVLPFRSEVRTTLIYAGLGCIFFYLLMYLGWGYNPVIRYLHAMEHHAQWKGFPWTWGNWWIATRVNIVEFVLWMGPLMPLFFLWRKKKDMVVWASLFFGLLFFGKAAGEIARLWLFVMPVYWIFVCRDERNQHWSYIVLMMIWTLLMKWQMDF